MKQLNSYKSYSFLSRSGTPPPTKRYSIPRRPLQCYTRDDGQGETHESVEVQVSRRAIASIAAGALYYSFTPAPSSADEATLETQVLEEFVDKAPMISAADLDTTITHKVYIDIGVAETMLKPAASRKIGDKSVLPEQVEPYGRVVIGLYGNIVPGTVENILAIFRQGLIVNTIVSKILPGEYILIGKQGSKRLGDLELPLNFLKPNNELTSGQSYKLTHLRPGTVSLNLTESDEDPNIRESSSYQPTELLITTGPGPVPRLDGLNVVVGKVLSGLGVISELTANVPTFVADGRSRALNKLAQFIGDDRAEAVRRKYGKPLKAVVITGAGELLLE